MKKSLLTVLGFLILQQSSGTTQPSVTYGCQPGTEQQCKTARFVPGHTLLGEGLNIVTMQTTGSFLLDLQRVGENCTICYNPHSKNVLQKLPEALVSWRPETSCSRNIISAVSESIVAMANDATSIVQNDWKVGLDVHVGVVGAKIAVGGSHSKLAKFAKSKSLTDRYSFLSHKLECSYYSFGLSSEATLTTHFEHELKNLPDSYENNKSEYRRLIEHFGTHYITQAKAGGRTQQVTAVRTCKVAIEDLTTDEVKDCLNVEAEISASTLDKSAKFDFTVKHCKEKSKNAEYGGSFHQRFSERKWEVKGGKATFDLLSAGKEKKDAFENWMESLITEPGLVSFSVDPIHNLVRFPGPQKNNLRLAVSDYIKEMAMLENCSCPGDSVPSRRRDCSCICSNSKYMDTSCCPRGKGLAKLHVTIGDAAGLRGDTFSKTDAYVIVKFDSSDTRTKTIWNNNDPYWNVTFDLSIVELSTQKKYMIEVWDEDSRFDDLLGKCEKPLTSGDKTETCYLKHGSITYSLSVTCIPHLHGPHCEAYSPVPPM